MMMPLCVSLRKSAYTVEEEGNDMAKKSKKRKRRRHQMKKSRQGQTRKKRSKAGGGSPSGFDYYDDDLGGPEIVIAKASGSDVPLVDDGYRIVGPAQAMVDYAKPLIDEAESEEDLNKALTFAQVLWNLALIGRSDPEEFEKQKKELTDEMGIPEADDIIKEMIVRFERMFPFTGRVPGFYVRERVIDIEEYEPFDESTLHISEDKIPPTRKEMKLAETLREIDPGEDTSDLIKWQNQVLDRYVEWCIAKGVPEDEAGHFAYNVNMYLDFLNNYSGETVSADTPPEVIQEFMQTHFIRKTSSPAERKTMMPYALKLFMQYLDEKGIVSGTEDVIRIVESEQDDFQENLKLFVNPSLGRKAR
jgi:hypothetical protein